MYNGPLLKLSVLLIYLLSALNQQQLPDGLSHMFPIRSEAAETEISEFVHSPMYVPDISADDAILYFNEVCLNSEFINSGDPSFVQKWTSPIYYTLEGDYSDSDAAAISSFADRLNSIEGFPGIYPAKDPGEWNLRIYFCSPQEMVALMGPNFENMDGGVTFWYSDNEIYDAIICILSDLEQPLRNSVLFEEIYNCLGPIQDTSLRPDSLIYQEYSETQQLTPTDELILKLLYHPDMLPGMDSQECEEVIRSLYY